MSEEWRPCPGWEDLYEVSSLGQIRRISTGRILTPRANNCGYAEVAMNRSVKHGGPGGGKSVKVHRLVALAFVPNPENKPQVNHIDTNRMNAEASNLEWMDRFQNHDHSASLGKYTAATNPKRAKKLTAEIIEDCRQRRAAGESFAKIADIYGVQPTSVYRALFGRPQQKRPGSPRRTWNWRSVLTDEEKAGIAAYDAAMEAVRLAKLHADSLRMEFTQIQSRALQRAKYQQLRAEQRAEQPSELQKAEG